MNFTVNNRLSAHGHSVGTVYKYMGGRLFEHWGRLAKKVKENRYYNIFYLKTWLNYKGLDNIHMWLDIYVRVSAHGRSFEHGGRLALGLQKTWEGAHSNMGA